MRPTQILFLLFVLVYLGGVLVLTLAGYNAGHRAVSRYMDIPPFAETQRYVRRVLRLYYHFKKHSKKSQESK